MSLLHLLFGFSGRINRGKYWLAVVLWLVFWAIALPACLLAGFYILGTNLVDGELPSGSDWLEKFVHMTLDYVVLFIIFLTLVSVSWIGVRHRHQTAARSQQERMADCAILCGSVHSRGYREHIRAGRGLVRVRARLFRHLDLGPGGAWLPARYCRPPPVWA